jgi:predicted lysophospholipase L1 biosynthesis ABC-type transport system permease subunit
VFSDDYDRQPNDRARLSTLFALIGVAIAAAAYYFAGRRSIVSPVIATGVVAAGCTVLGFFSLALAKRARLRRAVSLGRMGGAKLASFGRLLGTLVFCLGVGACVALAVYGVDSYLASR